MVAGGQGWGKWGAVIPWVQSFSSARNWKALELCCTTMGA